MVGELLGMTGGRLTPVEGTGAMSSHGGFTGALGNNLHPDSKGAVVEHCHGACGERRLG